MIVHNPAALAERPSCVLLDFDNTLYAYAPCNVAGMVAARAAAQTLLNLSPPDFDRCFTAARTELKARLGPVASSHSRLLYFQRTVERAGFASQPFTVLQLEQAFWRAYLDTARLLPNVMEFLDDLRIASIPAVIVTDQTAQIQMRKLILLGLDKAIDWIVTSEESGHDKPNAASFELAVAKLGGIEGPVWAVGDSLECDMAGARRALNASTLLKVEGAPHGTPRHEAVDAVFDSFADLRSLLARLA